MEIEYPPTTRKHDVHKDLQKETVDTLPPDKLKRLRESVHQTSPLSDLKLSRIADALMELDPDFSYNALNTANLK